MLYQLKRLINEIKCIFCPILRPIDYKLRPKRFTVNTNLDYMPIGWKKAFGKRLFKDLQNAINKYDLKDLYILEIKEKWGSLRIYTTKYDERIESIIDYYSELSAHTCIQCGKKATRMTVDWITPVCDKCAKNSMGSVPIEERK